VLTIAKSRFGARVPGVMVHMRGPGISQRARTNSRGIARFSVTPTQRGFVFFTGAPRTTAATRGPCTTFLAALAAKSGSVTG
jgi:hypothetical protein